MSLHRRLRKNIEKNEVYVYTLKIPEDVMVGKNPLSFRTYLSDVVLPLPFWRTRDGAALTDELMELIDSKENEITISDDLRGALENQMQLTDRGLGQLNPQLARASIKFIRALYDAERVKKI